MRSRWYQSRGRGWSRGRVAIGFRSPIAGRSLGASRTGLCINRGNMSIQIEPQKA